MSNLKREFTIQINGITQSVDAVKTLKSELQDCENIIKNLTNAKIDVKVSTGKATTTEKVGTGTSSTDSKVQLDIEKEKTKQVEMQNEALREQYIQREQLKQQNKEALDDIKQEAKGYVEVVDGVKEYANTLNGMSAELKDIKKELRNTDMDTEAFKELTDRAGELNEKLKKAEEAYGQFGRNVGNYTESVLEALRQWDEEKDFNVDFNISGAENSLNDLKAQLRELKQYWANLSPDNADFDKTAKAIKSLNQQIEDMESNLKDVGAEANSAFTGRFTTTIGGVEASFTNASEAAEALRKKLVAMRIAGEENTPMYQEIIQLVRRLSKEVMIANKQVEGMTKMTSNLNKVVGVMKGFSSIAALGQGIAGLFGEGSEQIEKFVQKFASISLVISGLSALEEELNKGTSAFARFTNSTNEIINKLPLIKQVGDALNGIIAVRDMQSAEKTLDGVNDSVNRLIPSMQQIYDDVYNVIQANSELNNSFNKLSKHDKFEFFNADSIDELKGVSSEMDDFVNKLQDAMNADESFKNKVEELFQSQKKAGEINNQQRKATMQLGEAQNAVASITGKFANALTSLAQKSALASKALYGVATALKFVMKTTVVLVLIEALMWAVEKLTDGLKFLWDLAKSKFEWLAFQQGEKDAKKLVSQIDSLNKKLNGLKQEREIQIKLGNVGEVEGQLKDLQDQIDMLKNQKITFDTDREFGEWQKQLIEAFKYLDKTDSSWQNLTQSEKEAAEALEAIAKIDPEFFKQLEGLGPEEQLEKINEELKKIGLNSVNMSSLESMDTKALEELLEKLSGIDVDLNDVKANSVEAFAEFGKALMKARQDTANAAARMKKDLVSLTQREYQLKLSLNDDDIKTRLEIVRLEMEALAQTYGMKIRQSGSVQKKDGSKMSDEERQIAQRIANINYLETKAAKKANKEAKDRKNKEAADGQKQAVDNAKKLSRAETAARLEAMEDGMDKEIAILEQKRKEEIEDAKETGKRVVDINIIYDRQILEVKKKYAKYIEDVEREHTKRLEDIAKDFLTSWSQIQREIEDTRTDTSMGNAENKNITVKQNISYDTNTQGSSEGINAQKKYYEQLKQSEIQYLNEKEQIEKEAAQRDYQRQLEDEEARFKASKDAQKKELEELERSLKEKVDAHQITEQEANKVLQETRDEYLKGEEKDLQTHNEKMQSITENGKAVLMNIELQYNEERKAATASALEEQRKVTQDFYNDIDTIMERTQKRKTNDFGFINYGAYRQSLQDALNSTKEVANQIESEKEALQKALDNNEISFDDFQKAKKELDDFGQEVKDKTDDLKYGLSNSFNTWMSGVMESINSYSSVLSGMFDSISELYTRQLDAEQAKLDKQQEILDAELEMIEENLQKQEEVTQEHNDKVNSIEDELKSARGDRRQALIDQLAAERKAQEQSIEKEKQLTEEKKKQAQKQEQLKKQQDALEKKRRQQEKRASIVQATINTFAAVSNALAVQPWFVGLALSAVALGLGMANVAQIASQQYGKGGKLDGPSHKNGGIPVGNTGITVEGNEYIIRKESTMPNLPLLEYINSSQRRLTKDDLIRFYDNGKTPLINRQMTTKFAEGGELPQLSVDVKSLMNNAQAQQDDRPLVVSVVDIVNQTENLRQVRVLAGDIDE